MKTELENADWIVAGIRESLEIIKEAQEEAEVLPSWMSRDGDTLMISDKD